MPAQKLQSLNKATRRNLITSIVVTVSVGIAGFVLAVIWAAGYGVSHEAENGNIMGAATVINAPEASAGKALKFGTNTPSSSSKGVLLSQAEIAALPTSGAAWEALLARANDKKGDPANVSVRGDHDIDVLANAFVGARLSDNSRKAYVRDELRKVVEANRDNNDVLATLRQLQTYVIAADIIDLKHFDPAFDAQFRKWLNEERKHDYAGGGGGGSVISTHNRKPNNFGTHAGSSRVAAAIYLGDKADLEAAAKVWEGWATGNPALIPDGYRWTGTNWQADPNRPAGINRAGATRDGHRLDGVIPEDQERCGEYSWPPCTTNYIHGAADGMLLAFYMLDRQGYDAWQWGDQAALRQYEWKYEVGQPPYNEYSEYRWPIPIVNDAYGTDFPGSDPAAIGKNFAFAAWWTR